MVNHHEIASNLIAPTLHLFYSLSGWGLGGAQPLAAAKARLHLAPTVYLCVRDFLFDFFVQEFLKGVWGKLLARSFPHIIFNKLY